MNDLNTISRLNAEAHAHSIHTARGAGRWVVARFTGLHLQSTSEHTTDADAQSTAANLAADATPDVRVVIYPPVGAGEPSTLQPGGITA